MKIFTFLFLLLGCFLPCRLRAASITLNQRNATVWLTTQTISGKVTGLNAKSLTVYCNTTAYITALNADNTFSVSVDLGSTANSIYASAKQGNTTITSNKVNLTLGYQPLPEAVPFATINGDIATLGETIIYAPKNSALKYSWAAAAGNPAPCQIANAHNAAANAVIPSANGTYYFDLTVTSGADSAGFRTYVVRSNTGLHAYDIANDHANWIDSAVIYEIDQSVFVKNGTYADVTAKLPEIKSLGVNTIWLQPITQTDDYNGEGYSVTDYFTLRTDEGTAQQLSDLITTAKKLHMRVLFDFVPNHTALAHPYAQDCIKNGASSHYYSFYQHTNDGAPYSSYYLFDKNGFVSYFYNQLVNLDYNNPEVQQWMIEATKYWLQKYDLDGYRFDSMWGVNARTPGFGAKLNSALKSIKPGLLLLAEEKSCDNIVYKNGFDAAYDWSGDTTWISQWAFAVKYSATKSFSIFNSQDVAGRSGLLQKAIFQSSSLTNRALRYLENNDQPRFIGNHTLGQTKMAAALMFSLPGMPMLFNGQEIGCKWTPNSVQPIFSKTSTIQQSDTLGLFPYYQKIINLHSANPALISTSTEQLPLLNSPDMLAFHRWNGNQHIIVIINLDAASAGTSFNAGSLAYLKGMNNLHDLLTGQDFGVSATTQVSMPGYSVRWLLAQPGSAPYKLVSFSGQKAGSGIQLSWVTQNAGDSVRFVLQKLNSMAGYEPLTSLQSNGQSAYSYTDPNPVTGANTYRLKQTLSDSTTIYSDTVTVNLATGSTGSFTVYPNPSRSAITINISDPGWATASYTADIYNVTGKKLKQENVQGNSWTENIDNYQTGIYILEVRQSNGQLVGKSKFVKVN